MSVRGKQALKERIRMLEENMTHLQGENDRVIGENRKLREEVRQNGFLVSRYSSFIDGIMGGSGEGEVVREKLKNFGCGQAEPYGTLRRNDLYQAGKDAMTKAVKELLGFHS